MGFLYSPLESSAQNFVFSPRVHKKALVNKLVHWCAWLLSGALEIPRLWLQIIRCGPWFQTVVYLCYITVDIPVSASQSISHSDRQSDGQSASYISMSVSNEAHAIIPAMDYTARGNSSSFSWSQSSGTIPHFSWHQQTTHYKYYNCYSKLYIIIIIFY